MSLKDIAEHYGLGCLFDSTNNDSHVDKLEALVRYVAKQSVIEAWGWAEYAASGISGGEFPPVPQDNQLDCIVDNALAECTEAAIRQKIEHQPK